MTNHHVGADTLAKLGTKDKDYYRDGFFAKTHEEEAKSPDLELNVLVGIEDVTARVNAELTPGLDDAAAEKARRKAMAEIEKESTDKTGLRSDVITLYQGGQYHLYTFKKYTDVRLVFAPEFAAAFFGGDPDNFEYPRYDLDVCFFRAYENGKPARPPHYLKWSKNGSKDGELVFVAGHPGRTDRLNTMASLEFLRDVSFPQSCLIICTPRKRSCSIMASAEPRRFASRRRTCSAFRTAGRPGSAAWAACATRPSWPARPRRRRSFASESPPIPGRRKPTSRPGTGSPRPRRWPPGCSSPTTSSSGASPSTPICSGSPASSSGLPRKRPSRTPTGSRSIASPPCRRWSCGSSRRPPSIPSTRKPSWRNRWPTGRRCSPICRWSIRSCAAGRRKRPRKTSFEIRSWLTSPSGRSLPAVGRQPSRACDDPMIKLALAVDAEARQVRKEREDKVEGVEATNYALIAKALFEDKGDSIYPDATFTLRLAYGVVKGYEVDGKSIPPYTTIGGAFAHADAHGNKDPYELPAVLARGQGVRGPQAGDAAQLRLDRGHHRRQLGKPGRQPRQRSRRPDLRRQHPVAGPRLRLRREDRPRRLGGLARDSSRRLRSIYKADRLVKELTGELNDAFASRSRPPAPRLARGAGLAADHCDALSALIQVTPRTSISSNMPVSSNEPMPTRP